MPDRATLDYLIVANHVEIVNGLLYISGGGWTELRRPRLADGSVPATHLGIGVSVCVPWNDTNHHQEVTISVAPEAGPDLAVVRAGVSVGRPPTLPEGSEQHALIGFSFELPFPKAGSYRVVARLNEGHEGSDEKVYKLYVFDISP